MGRFGAIALALAAAVLLNGCVSSSPEALAANDPFEPTNKAVFHFNERVDNYLILPVAGFYIYWMPTPLRRGLHNVLNNLEMPKTFANDVLQGEFKDAGTALGRFALNSTLGAGGLVDVATPAGLAYRPADFGQTLGRYGIAEGPFLVLPVFGPEPPRDLVGDAADIAMNPFFYLPAGAPMVQRAATSFGIKVGAPYEVHARNIVLRQNLEQGSIDPYITMRSIYRQQRDELISNGVPSEDAK
jgi:phospholipid-binding lipoprotein MlaA